jgi:Ca-activated chloride channel family protein
MRNTMLGVAGILGTCFWACSGSNDATNGAHSGTGGSIAGTGGSSAGTGGSTGGSGGLSTGGYSGSAGASSGGSGNGPGAGGSPPGADAGAPDAAPPACETLDPAKDAIFYLSADDSNSMASPAIARWHLDHGQMVPAWVIRTFEFLNYYNVGYPAAPSGTLSITTELQPGELESYELQIGVAAPAAAKPRRPMNLTFVLDTSGSMAGEPMSRQKSALLAIAGQLKQGDTVSMLTWNTVNNLELDSHVVLGPNDPVVTAKVNALSAGGGTNLSGGLQKGYQIAQKNFVANELNRVVLISDGMANVGVVDENVIGDGAKLNDGDGVYLVGVGVGSGVNDMLMNVVTDLGRGAYVYLDRPEEAGKIFGPRFDEVMDVAARSVQVELQLPWYMAISKFHGEEFSTNPEEIEPQHLAPNDAMVFNQIVRPCDPAVFSVDDQVQVTTRWQTPGTHQNKETQTSITLGQLLAATPKYLPKAKAIIAYAEALKTQSQAKLDEAMALVEAADPAHTDPELLEIAALLQKADAIY